MNLKLICASLAAAACVAGPAQAGVTKISTAVAYSDLDLTTEEGAAELERRARIAVLKMCANYDRRDALGDRPLRRCKQAARLNPTVDALVAQVRLERNANRDAQVAAK